MSIKKLFLCYNQCFMCFIAQRYKIYRIGGMLCAKNYLAVFSDTAVSAFGAVIKMPLRIVQYLFR